jgi:hypothetical protein
MADVQERRRVWRLFTWWFNQSFVLSPSERTMEGRIGKKDLQYMKEQFTYCWVYNSLVHSLVATSLYSWLISPSTSLPQLAAYPRGIKWGFIVIFPSLSAWASFRIIFYQPRLVELAKELDS